MKLYRLKSPRTSAALKGVCLILLALADTAGSVPADERQAGLRRFFAGHEGAFVMYDVRRRSFERYNAGRCRQRFLACSTRKVPDGLIGLETGVIADPDKKLKWDGTRYAITAHNRDHSLRTALEASTNWYFEKVTAAVGVERLRRYFRAFHYGNEEVGSDYEGEELKISAEEQVPFLLRLYQKQLPLSKRTQATMVEVMPREKTANGILRGKTGTGGHTMDGAPRRPDSEMVATLGWFVGWVEHQGDTHVFALNISGGDNPTGREAREITQRILKSKGLL